MTMRTIPTREERQAARAAKRLATCKHWQGMFGKPPCAVGVDLIAAVGPRVQAGWARAVPCLDNPDPAFVCDRKVTPTRQEVEAVEREFAESARLAFEVMAAIPADTALRSGTLPCPKCGGTVRWTRSPINGHRHAACDAGCVAFME